MVLDLVTTTDKNIKKIQLNDFSEPTGTNDQIILPEPGFDLPESNARIHAAQQ